MKIIFFGKRCDYAKGLEGRHLSWIIQVSPKCNHTFPFEGEMEGEQTHIVGDTEEEETHCHGGEIAMVQPQPRHTWRWETRGKDFSPESSEGAQPYDTLILNFWLPEL